jgi:hypothetical protein
MTVGCLTHAFTSMPQIELKYCEVLRLVQSNYDNGKIDDVF